MDIKERNRRAIEHQLDKTQSNIEQLWRGLTTYMEDQRRLAKVLAQDGTTEDAGIDHLPQEYLSSMSDEDFESWLRS
jgi:hypothetical protein